MLFCCVGDEEDDKERVSQDCEDDDDDDPENRYLQINKLINSYGYIVQGPQ